MESDNVYSAHIDSQLFDVRVRKNVQLPFCGSKIHT